MCANNIKIHPLTFNRMLALNLCTFCLMNEEFFFEITSTNFAPNDKTDSWPRTCFVVNINTVK